ncbi:MAG TPA: DUF1579 family protein [Candidatus Sulfotelmatobacter sp.]|nr:DUF1579 family protein [Candidatus Sulfotelmatobacter sp.]
MKTIGMTCAAILLFAGISAAQEMPKPGPEHKKMDIFAGSWTLEADMKASPMGPGGKITENEKCEWMEGSFFLVCYTDFKSVAMGNGTGLSIMGYDTDAKAYTYREFNSWGEFDNSKGSLDGDTWTWTSDEKFGKGRFTMKITSPTSYSFMFEMSQDGKTWTTLMDGKATKNK